MHPQIVRWLKWLLVAALIVALLFGCAFTVYVNRDMQTTQYFNWQIPPTAP